MPVHPNRRSPIRQIHNTNSNTLTHTQIHSTRKSSEPQLAPLTPEAGVTTLLVHPMTGDRGEHIRFVAELKALLP
jgi:hypothetical protein